MRNCHPEQSEGSLDCARLKEGSFAALRMTLLIGLLLLLIPFTIGAAQVGHPPHSTPYHDIRKGHTFAATGGYFSGDGGRFNIGPHDAFVYGVRYDIRTGGTIQMGIGIAHGSLDRFIVNPFVRLENRRSGPLRQSVTFADVVLQLNLTGGKSWHRIAPFIAAAGGLALAGSTPADTSGFDFGNKFYFAPSAGARIFLSDRLHFRAEARTTFWKLDYPATFLNEPVEEPGTVDNPNAVITDGKLSEWTTSSWLQLGLGYSFSL